MEWQNLIYKRWILPLAPKTVSCFRVKTFRNTFTSLRLLLWKCETIFSYVNIIYHGPIRNRHSHKRKVQIRPDHDQGVIKRSGSDFTSTAATSHRFRFIFNLTDWLTGCMKRIWLVNGSGSQICTSLMSISRDSERGFIHECFDAKTLHGFSRERRDPRFCRY
jgi:hypothetical protein